MSQKNSQQLPQNLDSSKKGKLGDHNNSQRRQMWKDSDSENIYLINMRKGSQYQIDAVGNRVKMYFNDITGKSTFVERRKKAQQEKNNKYVAQLPQKIKLDYEMMPLIMAQFQSSNHLPKKTQTQYFRAQQQKIYGQ